MAKIIKMPEKRIYRPDISQKIKDAIAKGEFTLSDLELARKVRQAILRRH